MKKSLQIFALLFCILVFAQAPEKFSYQAVIRNASNALVTNAAVGVKISILKTSAVGTVVYAESQTATTNANGLISIQIGSGTVITGTIAGINWSNDSYFIKTETDPTGGTAYSVAGTTQLLSVPYALYAKNSGTGSAFTLPYSGTSSADNVIPFRITNSSGTLNQAGYFENTNATNTAPAVQGKNNSTGSFGVGVQGTVNSNTNGNLSSGLSGRVSGTGTAGAGVYGYAQNAYGIYGSTDSGLAVRGFSAGTGTGGSFQSGSTGHALSTYGPVQLLNIGAAAGHVLTSDASGNATWQASTPIVHFSSVGGTTQSIGGGIVTINSWTGLEESGGANYNPTTGEYTIPVSGFYSVSAQLGFAGVPTVNGGAEVIIRKNGANLKFGLAPILPGSFYPFLHASIETQLVAGDKIAFAMDHSLPTALSLQANLSTCSIHLIHK
jgi:hypothetical protein